MSRERPISRAAWLEVLQAVWRETFTDHASLLAAGLAYYAVFGLFPALAAAAALWDLFGDSGEVRRLVDAHGDLLPAQVAQVLDQFLTRVRRGLGGGRS